MSELEKANVLHTLLQNFEVSEEMLNDLKSQLSEEIREKFDRITSGLKIEDFYQVIFSNLSWVKNINGLKQNQTEEHKKTYQVPDYSLLIEDSKKNTFPILVDVKRVKKEKSNCELIKKQIQVLQNYAKAEGKPLLIAIYWEKYLYWTHNSLENFTGVYKNKISFEHAVKNDLSHILSDVTYEIDKPIYRKIVVDKKKGENGAIIKAEIGLCENELKDYDIYDSAIIDAVFKTEVIDKVEDDNYIYQKDKTKDVLYMVKLSHWLLRCYYLWRIDALVNSADSESHFFNTYRRLIVSLLSHDLQFRTSYPLPSEHNKDTDRLFLLAYKNTEVMYHYVLSKKKRPHP